MGIPTAGSSPRQRKRNSAIRKAARDRAINEYVREVTRQLNLQLKAKDDAVEVISVLPDPAEVVK